MQNFMNLVEKARIELNSDYEKERRKSLENYYNAKKRKRADDLLDLYALGENESQVRNELNQIALQNQAKKHANRLEEVKEIMIALERMNQRDLNELKTIRKSFGLRK